VAELRIREERDHNVFVSGLSEKVVDSADEFSASFLPASRNRWAVSLSRCTIIVISLNYKTVLYC